MATPTRGPTGLARRTAKAALTATYLYSLRFVTGRHELPRLLNSRGLVGIGVEVGVAKGEFSQQILEGWEGRKLISVDSWGDPENPGELQHVHEERLAEARERLGAFGERSEIWRLESTEAARRVEPHSLDFVYIDAAHDFDSVAADLDAWGDRVRPGGILSGHDYYDGPWIGGVYGVRSAVRRYCSARGLKVRATRRGPVQGRSWMVEVR